MGEKTYLRMSVMLVMMMMLLAVTQADIEGEGSGYGEVVPVILNQTSTKCPCDELLLSSLGPAAHFQPKAMAIFTRNFSDYNKHPAYRMYYGADYRLYFTGYG